MYASRVISSPCSASTGLCLVSRRLRLREKPSSLPFRNANLGKEYRPSIEIDFSLRAVVTIPVASIRPNTRVEKALSEDSLDIEDMKTDVQTLLLMAEVHEAAGDDGQADASLARASELQGTILARSR